MSPRVQSILAVLAGFVTIFVVATGTDMLVKGAAAASYDASGGTSSVPILLLTIGYVAVAAVFGCYLTARLAPSAPMKHALVLGALGLIFNVLGAIFTWALFPAWFHVVQLLLVMPYAWLGGRLRERQLEAAIPSAAAMV